MKFTIGVQPDDYGPGDAASPVWIKLLQEAGQSIGIGDFRPEKRGPFGTFRVVKFDEATQQRSKP